MEQLRDRKYFGEMISSRLKVRTNYVQTLKRTPQEVRRVKLAGIPFQRIGRAFLDEVYQICRGA